MTDIEKLVILDRQINRAREIISKAREDIERELFLILPQELKDNN